MAGQTAARTLAPAANISHDIRIVTIGGEPWFVAADVCRALGMSLASGAGKWTQGLPSDEKGIASVDTPGGRQNVAVVSESGLYRLLMRSDKPQARALQDWVTRDVLPAIRKTGSYVMGGVVRGPHPGIPGGTGSFDNSRCSRAKASPRTP